VQLPGSESHQQCTEAIRAACLTAFAYNAILAQEQLRLSVTDCNQDKHRCDAVCFVCLVLSGCLLFLLASQLLCPAFLDPVIAPLSQAVHCRMVNGQRMEPLEEVVCEIEDEFSGPIIDALSLRRGEVRIHTSALARLADCPKLCF